jgi:hypothetical protein
MRHEYGTCMHMPYGTTMLVPTAHIPTWSNGPQYDVFWDSGGGGADTNYQG